jgi:signal transduction histidine kinase
MRQQPHAQVVDLRRKFALAFAGISLAAGLVFFAAMAVLKTTGQDSWSWSIFLLLICGVIGLSTSAGFRLGGRFSGSYPEFTPATRTSAEQNLHAKAEEASDHQTAEPAETSTDHDKKVDTNTVTLDYVRSILSAVHDPLFVLDTDGNITYANAAVETFLNVSNEEIITVALYDVLGLPHETDNAWRLVDFLAGVTLICPGDREIPVTISAGNMVRRSTGDVETVCIIRDMTELSRQMNELNRSKEEAQTASRMKSEFMATMSHELRTPLNHIIGFSEMIETQLLGPIENESYPKYAGEIRDAGRSLLAIINDILDIARIETGELTLQVEKLDPWKVARTCAGLARDRAKEAGIKLTVQMPVDVVEGFEADPRKMKQILMNLLTNAIKFNRKGGLVRVRGGFDEEWIMLAVEDTGIGMNEEEIALATQPFVQADLSDSRAHGGVGLGLSLARKLTLLHGGELEIHSSPGEGTTMLVRLPRNQLIDINDVA